MQRGSEIMANRKRKKLNIERNIDIILVDGVARGKCFSVSKKRGFSDPDLAEEFYNFLKGTGIKGVSIFTDRSKGQRAVEVDAYTDNYTIAVVLKSVLNTLFKDWKALNG